MKYKLTSPIETATGTITEVNIGDLVNTGQIWDMPLTQKPTIRDYVPAISMLTGLSEKDIALMHPKDTLYIIGEVGKFLI